MSGKPSFMVLDGAHLQESQSRMAVSPLPKRGTVLVGRDIAGRSLRISSHPEAGRVVLSIWDHERCVATVRLAETDVPDLVKSLTACLVVDEVQTATG